MRELGVFVRHWTPGEVKTRLAAAVGANAAAEVYRVSVAVTLKRFEEAADRRVVAYTPPGSREEIAGVAAENWTLRLQASGDLGARMEVFFEDAFRRGAERVVLIGSDSPTLPGAFVEQAFDELERAPLALGPAADGGYYLIGLARPMPKLFHDIAWSTAAVYEQTLARAAAMGVGCVALPWWYDFDTLEDLVRMRDELMQMKVLSRPPPPVYQPLLEAIHRALPSDT
jgi:rSAM/selenodomain-associated transferase 1